MRVVVEALSAFICRTARSEVRHRETVIRYLVYFVLHVAPYAMARVSSSIPAVIWAEVLELEVLMRTEVGAGRLASGSAKLPPDR